jgi:hypothetical protein
MVLWARLRFDSRLSEKNSCRVLWPTTQDTETTTAKSNTSQARKLAKVIPFPVKATAARKLAIAA